MNNYLVVDKEELREDKAVKISKKEVKTLMAELDEFADLYSKQQEQEQQEQLQQQQQQRSSKKKKTPDTSFVSVENSSPVSFRKIRNPQIIRDCNHSINVCPREIQWSIYCQY